MPTIKGVRQAGELSGSLELGQDKVISRYSLEFIVVADNASQGPLTIRSTAGLPLVGVDTYYYNGESDTTAICKRKTPRNEPKQPLIWYVRIDFDNDPTSQAQDSESDSPEATARPAIIEWDAEFGEEVLHRDFSTPKRKAILNAARMPYDPPVTRRVIYPVLTVERYQSTFLPATILAYTDHVNDDDFYGAAAGHALMTNIRARQVVEDGTKLWQVTYRIRFAISPDGFLLKPLEQGSHYIKASDGKRYPFESGDVPYIGNLKADGDRLRAEDDNDPVDPDDFIFADGFVPYPEADFDALSL